MDKIEMNVRVGKYWELLTTPGEPPQAPAEAKEASSSSAPAPNPARRKAALDRMHQAYSGIVSEENGEGSSSPEASEEPSDGILSAAESEGEAVVPASVFGSENEEVAELLQARTDLKWEDLAPFSGDPYFSEAMALLKSRPDIEFRELVTVKGGKEVLDPALFSRENLNLIEQRDDFKPGDVQSLSFAVEDTFEPLQRKSAREMVSGLLLERRDIKARDMVGLIKTLGQTFPEKDRLLALEDTCNLLLNRRDISAAQAQKLMENVAKNIEDPKERLSVFHKMTELLEKRNDLQPEQSEKMLDVFSDGVNEIGSGGNKDISGSRAKAQLFSSASDALIARPDLKPEQMIGMFEISKKSVGKGQDEMRLSHLAGFFSKGCELLAKRPDIQPGQVEDMMNVIENTMVGHDTMANAAKYSMLSRAVSLLMENPHLRPEDVSEMFLLASRNGRTNMERQAFFGDEIQKFEADRPKAIEELRKNDKAKPSDARKDDSSKA